MGKKLMKTAVLSTVFAVGFSVFHTKAEAQTFSDVGSDHPFRDDIQHLIDEDVTQGYPDGTFRPGNDLTRAEAATLIGRAVGLDGEERATSFPDVSEGHFASGYIESAVEEGIISGFPNGQFHPDQELTREQMAVILDRAYDFERAETHFTDLNEEAYSFAAIEALYGAGITNGYPDNTFRPQNNINRGEFSAFLTRSMKTVPAVENGDSDVEMTEAEEAVDALPDTVTWENRAAVEKAIRLVNEIKLAEGEEPDAEYMEQLKAATEALQTLKSERSAGRLSALVEDYESGSFLEKAFDYERVFSQNSYRGDIEADETFVFLEGDADSRVLVTAPHTVWHIREDDPKVYEQYTGSMALLLHEYTGAHVLFKLKEEQDANFYNDVPFKREMDRIAEEYAIDMVLDLHGAARFRDFDLDIGTSGERLASEEQVNSLMASMIMMEQDRVYENHTFTASNRANVANYAFNELGVEGMQLELHRTLREPNINPEDFYRTVYALSEYIVLFE